MIRSNVGNVTTNAMQILSVGATTGAHLLGDQMTAYDFMSKEEKHNVLKAQADKMVAKANEYNELGGYEGTKKVAESDRKERLKEKTDAELEIIEKLMSGYSFDTTTTDPSGKVTTVKKEFNKREVK